TSQPANAWETFFRTLTARPPRNRSNARDPLPNGLENVDSRDADPPRRTTVGRSQTKPWSLFSDPPGPSPPPARSSHAQPWPGDASSTIPDGSTPPQTSASSRESQALS